MKKIILINLLAFISIVSKAQDNTGVNISESITLNKSIVFSDLHISKNTKTGELYVNVIFIEKDSLGNVIDNIIITKYGTDYNDFWTNFNTGKYLYQQIQIKDSSGSLITIPDYVEQDFLNK